MVSVGILHLSAILPNGQVGRRAPSHEVFTHLYFQTAFDMGYARMRSGNDGPRGKL
jgi:hypothetical protein